MTVIDKKMGSLSTTTALIRIWMSLIPEDDTNNFVLNVNRKSVKNHTFTIFPHRIPSNLIFILELGPFDIERYFWF